MPGNKPKGFGGGSMNAKFNKEMSTLVKTALSGLAENRRSYGRVIFRSLPKASRKGV
jgi:hypothetical protein